MPASPAPLPAAGGLAGDTARAGRTAPFPRRSCSAGTAPRTLAAVARHVDPYHILVSEVMLQQTQVDRVLPKYHEWLEKFPTLDALAAADEAVVDRTWRPLGYNIRPRRLQAIAREAVIRFDGALPSDEDTLLSFKGLGRYTVGAIRSFAFRERAAILDTNVARVLFRVFVGRGEPKSHATIQQLWSISDGAAEEARVRLQPGAHGLRRDALHGTQAAAAGSVRCGADCKSVRLLKANDERRDHDRGRRTKGPHRRGGGRRRA